MQMAPSMKKSKTYQLLDNFFLYIFTALTCSLFCSSPFWFPSLCSSLKAFLFVSLPKVGLVLFSPKALFIVGNLIIIILVGESKFFASSESSPTNDVYYEEYISKGRSVRHSSTIEEKKKTCEDRHNRENKESWVEEEEEEEEMVNNGKDENKESWVEEEEEEVVENGKDEDAVNEEDEFAFPAEELSKRADDFIARVNRQRRFEATILLSCGE